MKPYKIFAEVVEQGAIDQFNAAMALDCVVQGALMPDAHAGYTLPIGAVVACRDYVFPSFVGYDIGCGMYAVPTTFDPVEVTANSKKIFDQIYRDVPVGFRHHDKAQRTDWLPPQLGTETWMNLLKAEGYHQLGTLGGGNHFIEIGVDEQSTVWIIIHSGSRNLGHKTASRYMALAANSEKPLEGHFGFDVESDLGRQYRDDLDASLAFALMNRALIADRVLYAIGRSTAGDPLPGPCVINRNHNHAEFRDGLWIHRKGATHAEDGMMGVIPGNMRDGSFIVRGKGNPDALWSSSHGAGRVMGRKVAKATLQLEDFKVAMEGVQARVTEATLDESPFAYKDIFEVMRLQEPLVEVLHHVRPIINIKG